MHDQNTSSAPWVASVVRVVGWCCARVPGMGRGCLRALVLPCVLSLDWTAASAWCVRAIIKLGECAVSSSLV